MASATEELSFYFHSVLITVNDDKCLVATVLYCAVLDCRSNMSKGTKLGGVLVRKTDV